MNPISLLVRTLIDQLVGGLRRAQAVVVELLVEVGLLQRAPLAGLVVAAVEEALVVVGPGGLRELDPVQGVRQVAAGVDVAHPPLLPVRAPRGEAVGEQLAVLADVPAGDGDRAVLRQGIGIEDEHAARRQGVDPVEDALVLQAVVAGEEVAPPVLRRHAVALVVPELGQPLADRLPLGQAGEKRRGHRVLRRHPVARLLRIEVLQPAVGIGNLDAMVVVHLLDTGCSGVDDPLLRRTLDRRMHDGLSSFRAHRHRRESEQGQNDTP